MQLTDFLAPKLLLALASTVALDHEAHRTHDHILLSDGSVILQGSHRTVIYCCASNRCRGACLLSPYLEAAG
jgi:hypothetical protein